MLKTFKLFHLTAVIRKRMELKKEDSLFLFVNNGKELLKSGRNKHLISRSFLEKNEYLHLN